MGEEWSQRKCIEKERQKKLKGDEDEREKKVCKKKGKQSLDEGIERQTQIKRDEQKNI